MRIFKLPTIPSDKPVGLVVTTAPTVAVPTLTVDEAQAALSQAQQARANIETRDKALRVELEQVKKAILIPGQDPGTLAARMERRDEIEQELDKKLPDQRVERDNGVILAENVLALLQYPVAKLAQWDAQVELQRARAAREELERLLAAAQQREALARVRDPQCAAASNGIRAEWTRRNAVDPSDRCPLDKVEEAIRVEWQQRQKNGA